VFQTRVIFASSSTGTSYLKIIDTVHNIINTTLVCKYQLLNYCTTN
jgi:hypothetical protein